MNPLTHFRKIRILSLLSLGVIFALAITAHAQNLYVSTQRPGSHAILEFTPSGTYSVYASGLLFPRGLAFDSIGNLFAAETVVPGDRDLSIGRVLKFNLRNKVSTVGSAVNFFFEGLAVDIAGNAYVMANDQTSPTGASTIFKLHQMENGSSSAPFLVRAGAWLSTARAISMQPTAAHKQSINSLRMGPALFSSGQVR